MKGLSIGRAELVNRFLTQERQRLGRSMASCSFQNEMQLQCDLLVGGASSRALTSAQLGGEPLVARKQLHNGLSQTPKTLLSVDKSEKPELEIADPLLLQEILAVFSASAEARKKAADRTGDHGALPVEDLISILEKSEKEAHFEAEVGEVIPAEIFRKIIDTIRWSDDKHKAFVHAENLAPQASYDRQSFIEELKNLLGAAHTQRASVTPSQPIDAFSPPADTSPPRDTIGPAGVFDAIPEDFNNVTADGSFCLWQRAEHGRKSRNERAVSENAEVHNAESGRENGSPRTENQQSHIEAPLVGADAQTNGPEVLEGASPSSPAGIAQEALQTDAPPSSFQGRDLWERGIGAFLGEAGTSPMSLPDDALGAPEQDLTPWEPLGRPSAVAMQTTPSSETDPGVQPRTADVPVDGPDTSPAVFLDMAAEVHEIVSDFSHPDDAAHAEDHFTETHVFMDDMGHGSEAWASDSSPFGERSRQNSDAFFQAAHWGSAQERVFSELAAAPLSQTTPTSPSATLSGNPFVETPNDNKMKLSNPSAMLSLLHSDWPKELGQKLLHTARNGKNFMTLELQPESLGKLLLRVETDGSRVSALLQTENPEAREILQRNMASLRDVLAEHGLQLSRFSVDVRHENTSFAERHVAQWVPNEEGAPSRSSKGAEGENVLKVLHVFDAGLGRALSVRV